MSRTFRLAAAAVAVATLGASATAGVATAQHNAQRGSDQREIRNVIYLLGDGMGRTHVTAARERYYGADGKLVMETMPHVGQNRTYSIEPNSGQPGEPDFVPNYVTDSASAATAWTTGQKTYNAALAVDGKGKSHATVMELAKKAGYRTGNVSTAEITDATPAGQMSHVLMRGCQGPEYSAKACQNTEVTGTELPTTDLRVTPVADQIARNNTADVIMGGGLSRFDAADEKALKDNGYTVLGSPAAQRVATEADMNRVKTSRRGPQKKVFALYNKGNLTIEKSKRENPTAPGAKEPTVAEMTRKSIELLDSKKGKKGFYLQVEGALIDKRSHANDAAQTLEETKAFDEAVRVALDFAKRDKHTLVIVTADHECAGFNIIEKGTYTNAEAATPPANVDSGNPANNSVPSRAKGSALDPKRSSGIINGAGKDDAANFGPATFRTPDDAAGVADGTPEASLWLSYLSGNHTGADVPVYGYGPGSSKVSGSIENTDLFGIVGQALGVVR
ncbi:alkaline phosphatase [Luteococcus sp.]|uniref:alkaline phosphatase n=1 Tax=Luteococcus sp. TaxID=1969402 RepID=UPI0037360666